MLNNILGERLSLAVKLLLSLLFAFPALSLAAAPVDAQAIANAGNGNGASACSVCHGTDGAGQAAAGFPRLAGLNSAYLKHQLDSFADGSRQNPIMSPLAKALSAAERQALADYFSKLAVPAALANPATSRQDSNVIGRQLATRGRWNEQLPACEQCHGPRGIGVGQHFPPLAGQSAVYIENQLKDWKKGSRHNDPLDLMKHVAAQLDTQDIKAVAQWFAAQPLTQQSANQGETP